MVTRRDKDLRNLRGGESGSPVAELTLTPKAAGRATQAVEAILDRLGDQTVARLYVEHVRNIRTRSYQLRAGQKVARVEVQRTLLGIELKIGRRRLLCPDDATARFLAVFARLGVEDVAVPYDISQMSRLAALFETAMTNLTKMLEAETAGMDVRLRGRIRNLLIAHQRDDISKAGAGPAVPQFDQNTRQRRRRLS